MTQKLWGADEIAYLAKNYARLGAIKCQKVLKDRTLSSIQCKARDFGFRKERKGAPDHVPDASVYDLIRMTFDARTLCSKERTTELNVKILEKKMKSCDDPVIQKRAQATIKNLMGLR